MAETKIKIDTDIEETLSKDLNEKSKKIIIKDEIRKKGTKVTDNDDNVWSLKDIYYRTYENEEGKDEKHRYGTWKKQGAFGKGMRKFSEKMDTVVQDDSKFTQLLAGLGVISESSKLDPQFKSLAGKVSTGLTKGLVTGKQLDIANKAAKAKLLKAEAGPDVIEIGGKDYADDYFKARMTTITDNRDAHDKSYINLQNRLTMLLGIKDQGIPTGLLPSILQPFEELLLGIFPAGSEQYEAYASMNPEKLQGLDLKDKVKFKTEFEALVRQATLDLAKQVYPVSEKDLVILQQSLGSVRTYGEALKQMVALQSGVAERNELYFEGLDKYMAQMSKDPMAKVTIDGVTATGFEQFAKKYADAMLKAKYSIITQDEVNAVLGTGIDVKTLQPFQLSVVANAMKLKPTNLESPDLAVLDTMFRLDTEAADLDELEKEINKSLEDEINKLE